ncbi:MAG: SufS family cysteine desulfurase [Candidatus Dormibacteraeota bacterium]|nr:SufS family cysteine desulfurase [Candidatus Dormibacteraeota bacterium]
MDVETLRRDFPFLATGVAYLDSANTSQRPRAVLEAMNAYFTQFNANIHRAAYAASEAATERYEATREKLRAYINAASRREIVYTRGTTEAINLVAHAWGRHHIGQGDLIVLTILEHHSNIVPWQLLAEERGARIEFVDIDEKGELRLDQFHRLLDRAPKLVAFAQVSNTLGTINPYAEMTAAARAAGATVLIDGAQGAPHLGIDVRATGCDFYAFSGHKMCGPTGAGVLYGRRELLEAMPPFMGGGDMIRSVTTSGSTFADLPEKFEAGTQAIAEVIGLGAAVDYLTGIGLGAIHEHEQALAGYALESLSEIGGVRLFGPPVERRAGVVSFDVAGIHPHDVATILDRGGVAIRAGHNCTMPLMQRLDVAATVRASFYLYSTSEEVDRLVAGLQEAKRIFG